jgi:hypothetical protein
VSVVRASDQVAREKTSPSAMVRALTSTPTRITAACVATSALGIPPHPRPTGRPTAFHTTVGSSVEANFGNAVTGASTSPLILQTAETAGSSARAGSASRESVLAGPVHLASPCVTQVASTSLRTLIIAVRVGLPVQVEAAPVARVRRSRMIRQTARLVEIWISSAAPKGGSIAVRKALLMTQTMMTRTIAASI